ncbi:polysaccharide biosynthesis protein [Proteinivorax hydrogeniformans]|uniref:Polysaccharide biosynthesis protein n=1 Tax=Proteinivorax hydrogeniformans TaxID=1826727 RepID=A0AAU8HU06_9FIRM
MNKENALFVKGTAILASAGLFARLMGAVYRIPLFEILGDEGMGYYQMAYPVYSSLIAISTAGIPIAISKLVSERVTQKDPRGAAQILRVATTLLIITGLFFSIILFLGADYYAENILMTPKAVYSLKSIAPAIFLAVLMSAFRGFFQGTQNMVPTALSQVVEQIVRVVTIFILAVAFVPMGVEYGAAGATFGAVMGMLAALCVMIVLVYRNRRKLTQIPSRNLVIQYRNRDVLGQIVKLALPISIASMVLPIIQLTDATLVPRRLVAAGFSRSEAAALYGVFTGAAMVLVNVPTLFTTAMAKSLVPSISEANAAQNLGAVKSRAGLAIRLTLLLGFPSALGLFILAEPIGVMLFDTADVAITLSIVCFSIIFLTLHQTTGAILQGMGKTYIPVTNLFIGALLKIILNYTLTAIPSLNIRGPAIGTVICYLISSSLNLYMVYKVTGVKLTVREYIYKPVLTSVIMGLVVWGTYQLVSAIGLFEFISKVHMRLQVTAETLFSITVGMLAYGLLLLVFNAITQKEIESVPLIGKRVIPYLKKLNLLK